MKILFCFGMLIPFLLSAEMKIDFLVGDVFVRPRGLSSAKAGRGQIVNPGDTIEAGKKSMAVISTGGNKITVREKTKVMLSENTDSAGKYGSLSVFAGNVNCKMDKLKKSGGRYDVNSASAVAAVRGTEFDVSVAENGATLLNVNEGSVLLTGIEKSVIVASNQESTVPLGYDPTEVKIQKKRDWTIWAEENKIANGKEKEVVEGALIRAKKLDADIVFLEAEIEKKTIEKEEYLKYAKAAAAKGDKRLRDEYFSKAHDAKRLAYSSKLKASYQADKIALVKNVSDGVYTWAEEKSLLQEDVSAITVIYEKHYIKYIKPVEDEAQMRQKILEKRRKKREGK
ncbi:MAG: FecR domain-containing protein [Spirochaetes bacterium]|nr:FecR domain-containing protein [Spirochaetota bacterium]